MALTPKPYNPLQRIFKAVFRGKPNILADVDVNRYHDILHRSIGDLWKIAGGDFSTIFTIDSLGYDSSGRLEYAFSWTAFTVVVQGCEFTVPAGSINGLTANDDYPSLRGYLAATKQLVTFADDPVLSGVNGSTLPSALPGADHEVYHSERLIWTVHPDPPALNPGEDLILPIASVVPMPGPAGKVARLYNLSLSAYSDRLKSILGDKFGVTNMIELNQVVLDLLYNYRGEPPGTVKMFMGNSSLHFDNTGLGLGAWASWARLNGQGGRIDARGRVPICYDGRPTNPGGGVWDAAYNTMGNLVGVKETTLVLANIPPHTHPIIASTSTSFGGFNAVPGVNPAGTESGGNTGSAGGSGGSALPFSNIPPAFVVDFVIRLF